VKRTPSWTVWRVVGIVVVTLAAVFAVQGGEYGTLDLFQQRARRHKLLAQIDSLEHQIDSLQRVKKAVANDTATQERIAREQFGMVRGTKEILYRFAEPDSASPKP
jgi:cell division protein FtsB